MATSDLASSFLLGIFLIWGPWHYCLLIVLQSSSFCFSWDHSWFSSFPGSSADKKNPPAMQQTCIQSLGLGDHLEEGMATHSGILAGRIPMDQGTRNLVGYSPWGHKESDTTDQLNSNKGLQKLLLGRASRSSVTPEKNRAYPGGGTWWGYCVNQIVGIRQKAGQMEWTDLCFLLLTSSRCSAYLQGEVERWNQCPQLIQTAGVEYQHTLSLWSEHLVMGRNGDQTHLNDLPAALSVVRLQRGW